MGSYDVIVLGTGGVGSAAAFHLARRGARVLGLDRFGGAHDRGSSHGATRLIRTAYFECADYVPLVRRAYELWDELERAGDEPLYRETGVVQVGPPDGDVIRGVLGAARMHGLEVDELGAVEFARRFPGLVLPDASTAVFERRAGLLFVERCVSAHLRRAAAHGAELRSDAAVTGWKADADGVTVRTESSTYTADKLVITAGAWAGGVLAELWAGTGIALRVRRKHVYWYACDDVRYDVDTGLPAFFYETDRGAYYGFPRLDASGVKVGRHSGGVEVADPLVDARGLEHDDVEHVEDFLGRFVPGVSRTRTGHSVCYYTMSPDEHFVVDRHPHHDNVCFAAGLSGHGFKFSSVLGEVLTEWTLDGRTEKPVAFLGIEGRG